MRLRKHGVRNNWNDGWRDERNLEGRGLRIESEKERNGAQLCRGTSGSVVALSKAHKFPNRWKMHFSNRAPGRFAQVDSFTDPKNTFLFTVSFAPLHTRTNPDSLIQRFSIRYRALFNFRWIKEIKTCSFLQVPPTISNSRSNMYNFIYLQWFWGRILTMKLHGMVSMQASFNFIYLEWLWGRILGWNYVCY